MKNYIHFAPDFSSSVC